MTQYARLGGAHVAYQVLGEGALDVLMAAEWTNHVELQWEQPACARFLERLASFCRLILFDRRGTGLSDPAAYDPAAGLEPWMDDVRAVLDATRSNRAAIVATGASGPVALLFAATHPERTQSLVLFNSTARFVADADYPHGIPESIIEGAVTWTRDNWGSGSTLRLVAPSIADNERAQQTHARIQRSSVSPGAAAAVQDMLLRIDVRDVLASVHVPTLVVHRTDDPMIPVEHGRYLAEHIEGARYVELPGEDHLYFAGNVAALLGEIEEFLVGTRVAHVDVDRVLATVLFTDIVGSTERAVAMGDAAWSALLDRHDAVVRHALQRYRGREIKTVGDGFFAVFDGPARAVQCACAVKEGLRDLGVVVRAGIHTGEVNVRGDDYAGIAVHIGARVGATARPGEVLVTQTVVDLVHGSGIRFEDRGRATLKGVPDDWQLWAVAGA